MPTNATPRNIGKSYVVTTADNGLPAFLGDASSSRASVKTIQFVPASGGFTGSFTVAARCYGPGGDANAAPFVLIPYRRLNLSGVAQDRALVTDPLPGTGFLIEVPLNGQTMILNVTATAGTGVLYSWDVVGSPT